MVALIMDINIDPGCCPLEAMWAGTSPWPQVAAQVTQISMTLAAAQPMDTYMASGSSTDQRHPQGLQWQYKPLTSIQTLVTAGPGT